MTRRIAPICLLALLASPALAQDAADAPSPEDAASELECTATPGGVECRVDLAEHAAGAVDAEAEDEEAGDATANGTDSDGPTADAGPEDAAEAEAPVLYCIAEDADGNPIANSTVSANTGTAVFNTLTEDDIDTIADVVCREEGALPEGGSDGGVEEVSPEDEGTATL